MMNTPIRFGVCGLGRIGIEHCRHFSAQPEHWHPVAFCDLDPARAQLVVDRYGGQGYTDYRQFLSNPDMELVIVATRSLDHVRHAEQALAAGKMVLLEKPIGVTAEDYATLQRLMRDYPEQLFCCHNHRFEAAFINARTIIDEGLLGRIHVVKFNKHHAFARRNDWQMRLDCGGGQLSVWGPHLLDQSLQLIGAPIREVSSYLRRILTAGDADDHVRILLTGENQVVAEIEISNAVALPNAYCTIYGDRGTLSYGQDQQEIHLKYLHPDFRWPETTANRATPQLGLASYGVEELPWVVRTHQVEPATNMWDYVEIELARHLHAAIRNGVPFPIQNSEALEVVRISEIVKQQNPQFQWIG
jgi:scyllo-inositol 2-dehydrogenase (NADP+)